MHIWSERPLMRAGEIAADVATLLAEAVDSAGGDAGPARSDGRAPSDPAPGD